MTDFPGKITNIHNHENPKNYHEKNKQLLVITIILGIVDVSELILSIGWSGLSEYINGANNTGATSRGKSRRRLSSKTFFTSLLIPDIIKTKLIVNLI